LKKSQEKEVPGPHKRRNYQCVFRRGVDQTVRADSLGSVLPHGKAKARKALGGWRKKVPSGKVKGAGMERSRFGGNGMATGGESLVGRRVRNWIFGN